MILLIFRITLRRTGEWSENNQLEDVWNELVWPKLRFILGFSWGPEETHENTQ
jgi:hypothetical protein